MKVYWCSLTEIIKISPRLTKLQLAKFGSFFETQCSYYLSVCRVYNTHALEACAINKTQEKSLEFTINRVLMKNFRTVSVDVIRECRLWFGIPDIKVLVVKRKKKFLMKYANSANGRCQLFGAVDLSEYWLSVFFCFIYLLVVFFLLPSLW